MLRWLGQISPSKTYRNLPCAHRRWRHDGHCSLIHGYSREFHLVFRCSERTENGFVMDFGALEAGVEGTG